MAKSKLNIPEIKKTNPGEDLKIAWWGGKQTADLIYNKQTVKNAIYLEQLGSKAAKQAFLDEHKKTPAQYIEEYYESQKAK